MNDYIELRLDVEQNGQADSALMTETVTDVLAAMLAEEGFESFCPDEKGLTAYIRKEQYRDEAVRDILGNIPFENLTVTAKAETVEGQDWNSEWEKHYFQPIVVGDRCVIHSSFHTDFPDCEHDIVIDPKMAFGTGHHATTSQIIEQLLDLPLRDKSVIDMGTGTGILAILAAMRGASPVVAIEIDPAAEANARENVVTNGHPEIDVRLGDASHLNGLQADIFIANINRNIITNDIAAYATALRPGGLMLLSGFYEHDIPVILEAAHPLGLAELTHTVKGDNWTCLVLRNDK
ncbi:MAG: 50S ribosomal protein L11 methyltransferase [Bacteroidales bacterium]|nr:50S ribosomal protein L11 methyltransferase [Bacteroidales bacterium]